MRSVQVRKTGLRLSAWQQQPLGPPRPCLIQRPFQGQQKQERYRGTISNIYHRAVPHLPRILQPELWANIIPSSIRVKAREAFANRQHKKTNPATYFIWIYLLIGSQAIRIIQTKNEAATYSRKADLQIQKLREVIRKLHAGEDVDVEKALGTGIPEEEQAWEDAIKEIEREERLWTEAKQKKREALEQETREDAEHERVKFEASPVNSNLGNDTPGGLPSLKFY